MVNTSIISFYLIPLYFVVGVNYLGDFKNMPRNVRLKNIFHNLLAMSLLLGPLLLASIIFPPFLAVFIVFIYLLMPYYLIKFFAILLFSKHD